MNLPIDDNNALDPLHLQAILLAKVIRRALKQRANINLSSEPSLELAQIVEFMKRMRVWSVDKFLGTTYISAVNFYKSEGDMDRHKALGAIIVYIGEEYIVDLFKKLGYPNLDEDDQEALEDACGTFCNLISAKFRNGLIQLGYPDLIMSHFTSFQNQVTNGVEYSTSERNKYKISFEIMDEIQIVVDLTMGKIEKVS